MAKPTIAGVPTGRWIEWDWKGNDWRKAKIEAVEGEWARITIRLRHRHLIRRIMPVADIEAHLAARPGNDRRRRGT